MYELLKNVLIYLKETLLLPLIMGGYMYMMDELPLYENKSKLFKNTIKPLQFYAKRICNYCNRVYSR